MARVAYCLPLGPIVGRPENGVTKVKEKGGKTAGPREGDLSQISAQRLAGGEIDLKANHKLLLTSDARRQDWGDTLNADRFQVCWQDG